MSKFTVCGLFAAATLAAVMTTASAQTFTNGGFETPQISANTGQSVPDGTTLGGWTSISPAGTAVALFNGSPFTDYGPREGTQYYAFNIFDASVGGAIFQNFTTVPGQQYQIGFSVARFGTGVGTPEITAQTFDTGDLATPTATQVGAGPILPANSGQYTDYTFLFTATSTSSRLLFSDTSSTTTSLDVGLDAVTLTPVPEPATVGLLATAGLGLAGFVRRRFC